MRSRSVRPLLIVAAAISFPLAWVAPPAVADPPEPIELALVSLNDFHGAVKDDWTVKVAGAIEGVRAQYGESNTLVLAAGDNIATKVDPFDSSSKSTSQDSKSLHFVPTLQVLNALDVDASAIGNHEFHNWYGALRTTMQDTADFPFLSANVVKSGAQPFQGYELFDVAGLKVAVIGATTRDAALLDPRLLLCGVSVTDPVDAVNATAAQLKAGANPPDIIVALYHEGAGDGASVRTRVREETSADVDVIFAGHTHLDEAFRASVPGAPAGTQRPVMQAGQFGAKVSKVVLKVDPVTKDVSDFTMELVGHPEMSNADLKETYPRVKAVDAIVPTASGYLERKSSTPVSVC